MVGLGRNGIMYRNALSVCRSINLSIYLSNQYIYKSSYMPYKSITVSIDTSMNYVFINLSLCPQIR